MRVWRQNAEIVLWPVIGEIPGSPAPANNPAGKSEVQKKDFIIGLNLAPLTEARRELLEIPPDIRGVIVLSIDDGSMFLGFGIRPGDVIESINQQPVNSPEEAMARLKQALVSERKNLLILINRHGTNRYLAMPLENEPYGAGRRLMPMNAALGWKGRMNCAGSMFCRKLAPKMPDR